MDPDTALAEIRAFREEVGAAEYVGAALVAAGRLVGAVEALDEWLSQGGFLPAAWQQGM